MSDRVDAMRWSTVVSSPQAMARWRRWLHLIYWSYFKPSFVTEVPDSNEIQLTYQGGVSGNAVLNDPILYKIGDAMGTRRLWMNTNLPYAFLIAGDPDDPQIPGLAAPDLSKIGVLREWCQTCTSARWMCVVSRSANINKSAYSVWLESHNDALLCKIRFYDQILSSWPETETTRTNHKYGLHIRV